MLSVIIPAYNEEKNIPEVVRATAKILDSQEIGYEILLVDDGSMDDTFGAIEAAAAVDDRIRGMRLSRNYGKEAAMLAGLEAAEGDCCVVLDADMQHPPAILPEMYRLWQDGAKIVQGVKKDRGEEPLLYKVSSGMFYGVISRFTGIDFRRASDYKLLDRKIVDILIALPEKTRFFRGLSVYYGFRQAEVEFAVAPRKHGVTNWNLRKLAVYAADSISAFTAFPLQIATWFGVILLTLFFILGLQTLGNYFTGRAMEGFTTVILLLLFIAGVLSVNLGIVGYYIAKIYEEVKARPSYIVEKVTGREKASRPPETHNRQGY